jgi:hypothetical protein
LSAGQYIDKQHKDELNKFFFDEWQELRKLLNTLSDFCDNYYYDNINKQSKEKLNEMYKNKPKAKEMAKIEPCDPTAIGDSIITNEAFCSNLDYDKLEATKHEFIDQNSRLSANEMALIYQYTGFIESKLL